MLKRKMSKRCLTRGGGGAMERVMGRVESRPGLQFSLSFCFGFFFCFFFVFCFSDGGERGGLTSWPRPGVGNPMYICRGRKAAVGKMKKQTNNQRIPVTQPYRTGLGQPARPAKPNVFRDPNVTQPTRSQALRSLRWASWSFGRCEVAPFSRNSVALGTDTKKHSFRHRCVPSSTRPLLAMNTQFATAVIPSFVALGAPTTGGHGRPFK
jgi:hypothetical protein